MGKTFELLNCDKHKALLLRSGRDPGEVRPDITHQVPARHWQHGLVWGVRGHAGVALAAGKCPRSVGYRLMALGWEHRHTRT